MQSRRKHTVSLVTRSRRHSAALLQLQLLLVSFTIHQVAPHFSPTIPLHVFLHHLPRHTCPLSLFFAQGLSVSALFLSVTFLRTNLDVSLLTAILCAPQAYKQLRRETREAQGRKLQLAQETGG